MAQGRHRLALIVLCCLMLVGIVKSNSHGDVHLIGSDQRDCEAFVYDQTDDTCCHPDCAGGTCSGPGYDQCFGQCSTWTEGQGPVQVINGKAIKYQDGDVGTGSKLQRAVAVVADDPLRSDSSMVVLDVDLSGFPALQKQYYPNERKLEIWGEAEPSDYEEIVNQITYDNTADTPSKDPRKICSAASDGDHATRSVCLIVGIELVNNHAPTVDATASGQPFQEQGNDVPVLSALEIDDSDHPDLPEFFMTRARVTVVGGAATDQVFVDVSSSGGAITVPGGNWKTEVILVGPASAATFKQVLLTTRFRSTDDEPDLHPRTIEFEISDGQFSDSDTVSQIVEGINDRNPVVLTGSTPNSFSEELRNPVAVTPNLVLDDPDKFAVDYFFSANVSICQEGICPAQHDWSPDLHYEELNITTNTELTVSYAQHNGMDDKTRIVISGMQPKEEYERVISTLLYHNSHGNISCPVSRIIYISVSDGVNTGSARATIRIEFINAHPPEVEATSTTAVYKEDGPPVHFAPDIVITDPDRRCNTSLLHDVQFKVHNYDGLANEIMAVDDTLATSLGISQTLQVEGDLVVLVLEGVAETRDYQRLARTVTYQNKKDETTRFERDITARAFDGQAFSNIIAFNITIMTRNDQEPQLKLNKASFTYTENGNNVFLGPSMLTDDDSRPMDRYILWMSVILRNRKDGSKENLFFDETLVNSESQIIIGAADDGFRIEALDQTHGAPIELFERVIDTIYYYTSADDPNPEGEPTPGEREIVFEFASNVISSKDAPQTSHSFTLTVVGINDNNPVVDLNGGENGIDYSGQFQEESASPVPLSSDLRVTDRDVQPRTLIKEATIWVNGSGSEHVIRIDATGHSLTVTGLGTSNVHINGTADRRVYEQVLATATYENTADEPSAPTFDIEFEVVDEDYRRSDAATATITIVFTCDPLEVFLDNDEPFYATNFSELHKTPVKIVNDAISPFGNNGFRFEDDDSNFINRGTISIVGFQPGWEDRLRVLDDAGNEMTDSQGVTITWKNGRLTFEGHGYLDVYESLVRKVHYDNLDPCPNSLFVQVVFNFTDGCGALSLPALTNITIDPANDPPTLDLDPLTTQDPLRLTFTFRGITNLDPQPLLLFERAVLTDCDTQNFMKYLYIIIAEAGDAESDEEYVEFDVTGTTLEVNHTIADFEPTYTLTPRSGTTATPQQFERVLRTAKYRNVATKPFENIRQVTLQASDGHSVGEASAVIFMERIPLGPIVTLGQVVFDDYLVQDPPAHLSFLNTSGFNVEVGDIHFIKSVTITITNPASEGGNLVDHLHAPSASLLPTNWVITGDGTSELKLQSRFPMSLATGPDVKALLEEVAFSSTALGRHDSRIITIEAFDLVRSGEIKTVTIVIEPLNDPPSVSVISAHPQFNEGSSAVAVYAGVTINDTDDDNLEQVTIVLTLNATTETCSGGSPGDLSGLPLSRSGCVNGNDNDIRAECLEFSGNTGIFRLHYVYSMHSLTLTITSVTSTLRSKSQYEDLLSTLSYSNTATNPGNAFRILSLTVDDGKEQSDPPEVVYVRIHLSNNNVPTLTISQATATFQEGGSTQQPIILGASTVTISDPDCGAIVNKARAVLTGGGDTESLSLDLVGFPSLTANYDPSTATLMIEGEDDYEDVLKGIEYSNPDDEPGPDARTVQYSVFDGMSWSAPIAVTINFQLINDNGPTLDLDSTSAGNDYMATFKEGLGGVAIASSGNVQVTDGDIDAAIHEVIIQLTGAVDGSEEEIVSTQPGNAPKRALNTFTFTFTSPKSLSATEAFIESLQYINDAPDPTEGDRQAHVKINDGISDSNIATATIRVDATNDNPPTVNETFSASVAENSASDVSVVMIDAQDADGDALTYSITGGDGVGHFTISDQSSGEITTTSTGLDREIKDTYTLIVLVSDGMFNVSTTVSIQVTDVNDNCPTFDVSSYSKTLSSTASVNDVVANLMISDNDESPILQATITDGNGAGLFSISESNVVVASSLSSSQFTAHTLTVVLTDSQQAGCSDTATVSIVIVASSSQFNFNVEEEQSSGAVVGQMITAPGFPATTYTITSPPSAPFSIDTQSEITTTAVLDRETVPQHTLTVQFTIDSQLVTVTVQITVDDINDNNPEFSSSSYNETIPEDTPTGTTVPIGISVSDSDSGVNGQWTLDVSGTTKFGIDGVNIDILQALDYEDQCSYTFQVIATDGGGNTATANVQITVSNVNELEPVFEAVQAITITEAFQPGDDVVTVTATDPDKCPSQLNAAGIISYAFEGDPGPFRIDPASGLIEVDSALSVTLYRPVVRASDNDGAGLTQDLTLNIAVDEVTSPVVDLNGAADGIDTSVSLSESDPPEVALIESSSGGVVQSSISLTSVSIRITNPVDGANEKLIAAPLFPITDSYDGSSHTLTLSGGANQNAYSDALKTVKYQHDSMTNILQLTGASLNQDRTIEITATNQNNVQSATATATLSLDATHGCPPGSSLIEVTTSSSLAMYSEVRVIDCDFIIACASTVGCDIDSLASLNNLQRINGHLQIEQTVITDLSGLENLEHFESLMLDTNPNLATTTHLRSAVHGPLDITGNIEILNCINLEDVEGLRGIVHIAGDLKLEDSNLANGLLGLEYLQSIGGDFILAMNNKLKDLKALQNLTSIGGSFQLQTNNALQSVEGLEALETISGSLVVFNNDLLEKLCPLSQRDPGNQVLNSIQGDILIMLNDILCVDTSLWPAKTQFPPPAPGACTCP